MDSLTLAVLTEELNRQKKVNEQINEERNKLPSSIYDLHYEVKRSISTYHMSDSERKEYSEKVKMLENSPEYNYFLTVKNSLTDVNSYELNISRVKYSLSIKLKKNKQDSGAIAPIQADVEISVNGSILYKYQRQEIIHTQYMRGTDRSTSRVNYLTLVTPSDMRLYTFLMLSFLRILNPEHILLQSYNRKISKMKEQNQGINYNIENYESSENDINLLYNYNIYNDEFFTDLAIIVGLIAINELVDNDNYVDDSDNSLDDNYSDDSDNQDFDDSQDDSDFDGTSDVDNDFDDTESYE